MFQVESLKIEEEQGRPLVALLSTDILVLVFDNGSDAGQVELFTVIRLVRPTHYQCASACGKEGKTLRIVDPQRAIMYLEAPSSTDAQEWASAINQQAAAF